MTDIVSEVADVDLMAPLLDQHRPLYGAHSLRPAISVTFDNEVHGLIMSQYENPPMLLVEIILSIHSVGSLDFSFFIN